MGFKSRDSNRQKLKIARFVIRIARFETSKGRAQEAQHAILALDCQPEEGSKLKALEEYQAAVSC